MHTLRRYPGIAAVAVLWTTIGGASLLSGFPLLGERPLSWLAAEGLPASLLFGAGLAAGAVLLVGFHDQVRRRYRVGRWFSVAMLLGLAGQLVAAAVPIDGGPPAHLVHTVAALTLGASLPALMGSFAVAQPPGRQRRLAVGLFAAEAAACLVGMALSRASVAPLAEILPAVCFHAWVLTFSVLGPAGGHQPGRGREPHAGVAGVGLQHGP